MGLTSGIWHAGKAGCNLRGTGLLLYQTIPKLLLYFPLSKVAERSE